MPSIDNFLTAGAVLEENLTEIYMRDQRLVMRTVFDILMGICVSFVGVMPFLGN